MIVNKGNTNPVFPGYNFTQDEIYKAHYGNVGDSFEISDKTIHGAQIIRSYYNIPFVVSASKRSKEHEIARGRSGTGTHARGIALDLDPTGPKADAVILDYHQQILNKGPLYQKLRQAGINGIGLYDGFMHIDSRPEGGKQPDKQFGSWAFWDNRVSTKKKSQA